MSLAVMQKARPKRQLDRADSETNTRRKTLVCLTCKKRPTSSSDWAAYDKRGRVSTAVGERCLECENVWTKAFGYLSWERFSKVQSTEDRHGVRDMRVVVVP